MSNAPTIHGVYAVTEPLPGGFPDLHERVAAVLRGGVRVVQYRDKGDDRERRLREACALRELCRIHGALFIVNDDVALAGASGADGVHLGADDPTLDLARGELGDDAVIGVSCYGSLERADRVAADGADYLAFGSVYPSPTKPRAPRVDLETLRAAAGRFDRPVVAIGGIAPDNAAPVVACGVDAVAVISGLFRADDPERAASALAALFATPA